MTSFNSLSDFSSHLKKLCSTYEKNKLLALNVIGQELQKDARSSIGHLQETHGQFKAWEELAESTKSDKERKGYVFNSDYNPLYRTGELMHSIKYSVDKLGSEVKLGSDDQIMVWQELGTANIPPRSVLGMTMYRSEPIIKIEIKRMFGRWLNGSI